MIIIDYSAVDDLSRLTSSYDFVGYHVSL